jgi:arylsulfatase A-like enzyme
MITISRKIWILLAGCAGSYALAAQTAQQVPAVKTDRDRTLIVFFDGLRPDYITAEVMPNLYAFKQKACYGTQHHSVFPTVTRVNSASYSTGSYPATHGLMGNTVYFPQVNKIKGLDTGEAEDLNKINAATNGHLLTTTSLGEVLQAAGEKMMVFSSGSTGQALLQNHTVSGGAILNPAMILPAAIAPEVIKEIGPVPAYTKPNTGRHTWVANAFMKYGMATDGPLVSAIWFSDPDGAAHSDGIGSPLALKALAAVDHEFGRIIDSLEHSRLLAHFNILISTDHGFVTYAGKDDVTSFLIREGLKKDKESTDVVVSEGAIYVNGHDTAIIHAIVQRLQAQEWVGALYTKGAKPGSMQGIVSGTLSFESIHWNHADRCGDILVAPNWDDRKNGAGFAGTSFSRGVAGHGGSSPYEIHIPFMASGPAFKKAWQNNLPSSNVDLVPTVLALYHLPVPASMDGRVLSELFAGKAARPGAATIQTITTKAPYAGGNYQLTLEISQLGKYRYVNYTKVIRIAEVTGKQ